MVDHEQYCQCGPQCGGRRNHSLGTYYVGLNPDAELLLDWVSKRRDEEAEARRMAEQYPAVADALGVVPEAEQQLKTIVALCRV